MLREGVKVFSPHKTRRTWAHAMYENKRATGIQFTRFFEKNSSVFPWEEVRTSAESTVVRLDCSSLNGSINRGERSHTSTAGEESLPKVTYLAHSVSPGLCG